MQNYSSLASKLRSEIEVTGERTLVEGSVFFNTQKMHAFLIIIIVSIFIKLVKVVILSQVFSPFKISLLSLNLVSKIM